MAIARGFTNREAATHLFISEATVKTHLLHIYTKLGVNDRAAAVAAAFERGLLSSVAPPRVEERLKKDIMTKVAKGSFEQTSWSEEPYLELDSKAKLTRAEVTQKWVGDITGDGAVRYLMCYQPDGTAAYVGLQRVVGELDGRSGSAVLELSGTYDGTETKTNWSVVRGSGTDGWSGLQGKGGFVAPHGPTATYTLEYEFKDEN